MTSSSVIIPYRIFTGNWSARVVTDANLSSLNPFINNPLSPVLYGKAHFAFHAMLHILGRLQSYVLILL